MPITVTYSPTKQISERDGTLFYGGYLFLQKIFYELGLNKTCSAISKKYKYEYNLTDILSKLIYGRILFPGSKASTYEETEKLLEGPSFEQHDIYRALEVLSKENDFIQSETYKHSRNAVNRNDGILYYDCTNFFFEIEEEAGLKQYGISKEHRPNPIVQMGLFMDGDGIPMAFTIYPGNENEQRSMKPLEEKIIQDFEKSRFIVCTDAGLSGMVNRQFNSIQQRSFITTQSVKKLKAYQKSWALDPDGWKISGDQGKYSILKIQEDENLYKQFFDTIFYKEAWFKDDNGFEQRYIVSFSLKYKEYLRSVRECQIQRAQKKLERGDVNRKSQTDPDRFYEQLYFTLDGEIADQSKTRINEEKIADEMAKIIQSQGEINCTACKYCMEVCPKNINIPASFSLYNQYKVVKNKMMFNIYYETLAKEERPENCIKCGLCSKNCPQNLDIPNLLTKVTEEYKKTKEG